VRVPVISACAAILAGAAELQVDPPDIFLSGPGAIQRLIVSSDGADVTGAAKIRSLDPGVVGVKDGAVLSAVSKGEARVAVTHGGIRKEIRVRAGGVLAGPTVSFTRDVLSILTIKGCNGSSCHGSPAGQSGFKLSLYGSGAADDRETIVKGHGGRRVDLANATNSLILRKPGLELPHGGGKLIAKDSDEYRSMLRWLEQGASLDDGGARLDALEIYPRDRILVGLGSKQPLAVVGRLSDGTTRDMSSEVRYTVVDAGVVSEPSGGSVSASGEGLTTVLARAMGKTAVAQFVVIREKAGLDYPRMAAANFIDEHVYRGLRGANIVPYPLASDRMFLRRVYLDAIGQLPEPEEIRAFLEDSRPDRRARLIDALLERPEYARHWTVKFEDWFRNSQFNSQGRTNGSFKKWIREMVEEDRPYDVTVTQLLTSAGDTTVRPAGNFWHPATDFMLKTFDVNKITPTVSRLFLGVRIECAECHNHPLENLTQDDFYGMAAFFARLKVKHGYGQYRRVWYNEREGEVRHPVTRGAVAPKFLGGETPAIGEDEDRRAVLARWITAQPQFRRATVNRIWAEYFQTGIVDPPDDFRSTNRPTNPELLDQLGRYFANSGHRFKPLHRLILNSRVYQSASRTPERPGESGPLERALFVRYEPRQLSAETLLDMIGQSTGVAHDYRIYPRGTSAKDLIATNGPEYFLGVFGFPRRDILAPRTETPSLAQSLHMMNSDTIRLKVENEVNILGTLLNGRLDDRAIVDSLWERTLCRPATDAEWQSISRHISREREAGRGRRRVLESVLWVALNSKEFRMNQ
jgi:hypothetical protein